ncbi:MAG: class IV adenylate cyclase [Promethearchaeota archaeon]
MIEVEIKVGISNPAEIKNMLEKNNAFYKSSLYHQDTYFNMPKGLRDFKETDEALRVRKSLEFNKKDEKETKKIICSITYKGKKIDSITKTRKEIEVNLDDFEKIIEILKVLGFQEFLTIKKERELYEVEYKSKKLSLLVDFIPILNRYFLEVEIMAENVNDVENFRNILLKFLNLLGIDKKESIRKSYLELIMDKYDGP